MSDPADETQKFTFEQASHVEGEQASFSYLLRAAWNVAGCGIEESDDTSVVRKFEDIQSLLEKYEEEFSKLIESIYHSKDKKAA